MSKNKELNQNKKLEKDLTDFFKGSKFFSYPYDNFKEILNLILPLQLEFESMLEHMIYEKLMAYFGKRKVSLNNALWFYETLEIILEKVTFFNKIRIAKEMGLISSKLFNSLVKVNIHRNKLAHSKTTITFVNFSLHDSKGRQNLINMLNDFKIAGDLINREFNPKRPTIVG